MSCFMLVRTLVLMSCLTLPLLIFSMAKQAFKSLKHQAHLNMWDSCLDKIFRSNLKACLRIKSFCMLLRLDVYFSCIQAFPCRLDPGIQKFPSGSCSMDPCQYSSHLNRAWLIFLRKHAQVCSWGAIFLAHPDHAW